MPRVGVAIQSVHLMDCNWQNRADDNHYTKKVLAIVYVDGAVEVHCPVKGHHECTLELYVEPKIK